MCTAPIFLLVLFCGIINEADPLLNTYEWYLSDFPAALTPVEGWVLSTEIKM